MHQYLKSIGFGGIGSKKELYKILDDVENKFTYHELVCMEEGLDFCEYQKEYGAGIGISLFGDLDIHEHFKKEYYFPFFIGTGITSYAEVMVDRRMDRESYIGVCEDAKIGISLIFHLQNTLEYLMEKELRKGRVSYSSVTLSGLSNSGVILLPVKKDKIQVKQQKDEARNRINLMNAARNGDPLAIESLTLENIDTYSKVSKRLITEDVFSIVDTYIMPYGVECDRYAILGEIKALDTIVNEFTGEEIYIMRLDVNELSFDTCVPVKAVMGEAAVGRRFKADIWLQGRINLGTGEN